MLTHEVARRLWTKLAECPPEWFETPAAREIFDKCYALIEERAGKEEADVFANLWTVAAFLPVMK